MSTPITPEELKEITEYFCGKYGKITDPSGKGARILQELVRLQKREAAFKEHMHAAVTAGEKAAQDWEPFTQNHCPSYLSALRDAYRSGYTTGARAAIDAAMDSEGRKQ